MQKNLKIKDSGVAWLGQIPEGWKMLKFKFLYKASMGATILAQNLIENGKIPVYSATESDKIFGYVNESSVVLKKDDLVIPARGNSIGNLMIVKEERATSTQTTIYAKKLRDNKNNIDFIFYYCKSLANHLFEYEVTAIPQITVGQVKENPILIPPLETQKAIADYLDEKTSQIAKFIADKKKMVELLKEQKQAIIHQATTKGIDKKAKMKDSGVAWLGKVPQGWEVRKLKFLGKIINGSTPLSSERSYWDGDIDWITPTDLGNSDDPKLYSSGRKITKLGLDSCGSTIVPANSIILSCRAPIGSIGITTKEMCTNQGCKSFIPNASLNYAFAYNYFVALNEYLQNLGKGTTFQELSTTEFADSTFLLPPLETQKKIVSYIEKETSQIDTAIKKIEQEVELVEEYKKSLIFHATTGKITIN